MTEHHRRSIRLPGFDYAAAGAYFVTICSYRRELMFEQPAVGEIIERTWSQIPSHFSAATDMFVVMPNHVHGIIWIGDANVSVGVQHAGPLQTQGPFVTPGSLGAIVRSFKSATTRELHLRKLVNGPVWQRNYYDRVIRNEVELDRFREYIAFNPTAWQFDHENSQWENNAEYERTWSWIERGRAGFEGL